MPSSAIAKRLGAMTAKRNHEDRKLTDALLTKCLATCWETEGAAAACKAKSGKTSHGFKFEFDQRKLSVEDIFRCLPAELKEARKHKDVHAYVREHPDDASKHEYEVILYWEIASEECLAALAGEEAPRQEEEPPISRLGQIVEFEELPGLLVHWLVEKENVDGTLLIRKQTGVHHSMGKHISRDQVRVFYKPCS